ncbi:hypothetical protein WJX72_008087 [[Myrmecia] bisecta]|uniref:PKD/REJ-like domain-containing protein n=1 Tax=[Myrmecia] bisecta TaxID=41462 RepID=A0AAW1R7U2_9CHLO
MCPAVDLTVKQPVLGTSPRCTFCTGVIGVQFNSWEAYRTPTGGPDCTLCIMSSALYGDLSAAGYYSGQGDDFADACFTFLGMGVPSNSHACCMPLAATSYLKTKLNLAGLQPARDVCLATPTCTFPVSCEANSGSPADPCSSLTGAGESGCKQLAGCACVNQQCVDQCQGCADCVKTLQADFVSAIYNAKFGTNKQSELAKDCKGFCLPAQIKATKAQMTDDGTRIVVSFNGKVSLAIPTGAAAATSNPRDVFDKATSDLFGPTATLSMQDPTSLLVSLDPTFTAQAGSKLTIKAGSLLVDALTGSRPVTAGDVAGNLQAAANPVPPKAVVGGPTQIGGSCPGKASTFMVTFDGSASPPNSGRPLAKYKWSTNDANPPTALTDAISATNASRLSLSPTQVATLPAGAHSVTLTVTDWLGNTGSASWSFTKATMPLPNIAIAGGNSQSFPIGAGINVAANIDLATVCSGTKVTYTWAATGSNTFTSTIADPSNKNLVIPRPVVGATAGTVYQFSLTASLDIPGGASGTAVSTTVSLTAAASPVVAVLQGPQGDVLGNGDVTFFSASVDPDADPSTAFQYVFTCNRYNAARTVKLPCYPAGVTPVTLTNGTYTFPAGSVTADKDYVFEITMTASKGSRSDTDKAVIRVLPTKDASGNVIPVPPTGSTARVCLSTCPKKHSPTDTLRLQFTANGASAGYTYAWTCGGLELTAAGVAHGADSANLVVYSLDSAGNAVLPDGQTITCQAKAALRAVDATFEAALALGAAPLNVDEPPYMYGSSTDPTRGLAGFYSAAKLAGSSVYLDSAAPNGPGSSGRHLLETTLTINPGTSFMIDTFTAEPQRRYKAAITDAATAMGLDVTVSITPRAGSVVVDTVVKVVQGKGSIAQQFYNKITNASTQAQVFDTTYFGSVQVSGTSPHTQQKPSSSHTRKAAIAGGTIGGFVGLVMLCSAFYIYRRRQDYNTIERALATTQRAPDAGLQAQGNYQAPAAI